MSRIRGFFPMAIILFLFATPFIPLNALAQQSPPPAKDQKPPAAMPEPTDPKAKYNLGLKYLNGDGVPRDYAAAVRWFRKAADQGFPEAQTNLGFMYAKGLGVPQDYTEAMKWCRKAADQGH